MDLPLARSQRNLCQELRPLPPTAPADSMNLENRMKKLEENLAKQHRQTVEEALKNVRTLASRQKLVSPGVLIAAFEVLVDNASAGGHPDEDFFQKALIACRQHEEHQDLCSLCLFITYK